MNHASPFHAVRSICLKIATVQQLLVASTSWVERQYRVCWRLKIQDDILTNNFSPRVSHVNKGTFCVKVSASVPSTGTIHCICLSLIGQVSSLSPATEADDCLANKHRMTCRSVYVDIIPLIEAARTELAIHNRCHYFHFLSLAVIL